MNVQGSASYEKGLPPRRLSLRIALIIPFLLLILLTSGLIALISLHSGRDSIQVLADDLRKLLLAGVEKDLRHYLEMPHKLNAVNVRLIETTPGLLENFGRLGTEFLAGLRTFDSVMACGVGTEPHGEFLGVGHREEGGFDTAFMRVALGGGYHHHELDEQGNLGRLLKIVPDYDARRRAWYQVAIQAGKPAWSPVYIWAAQTNIGITAVLPMYDERGGLLGVQQSALSLDHMSRFARSLTGGYAGQAFIMERSGLLVASSADDRVVSRDADGGLARMHAVESGDPLVRAGALKLKESFEDFTHVSESLERTFDIGGERHLMHARVFADGHGLEWIVTMVVPEAQFLERVQSNFHTTILLCVAALLLACIVGVFISHRITQPILQLKGAAKDLALGKWDPSGMPVDRGDELGELASSFASMAAQMRDLVTTLENRVAERTETLAIANAHLQEEVAERERVESSLRRSEERLRLAFRAANDVLWDWDLAKNELYLSSSWSEMLGLGEKEEAQSVDLLRGLTHPEDMGRVASEIRSALKAPGNAFGVEFRVMHKEGHAIPVRARGFILRDKQGRAVRVVGTTTDLTERKRAEEERARWERGLQQAQKAEGLGRMAGAIAHHFNNMLGAVMGNLELALLEHSGGTAGGRIVDAMKASRRAAEISRLMLTYVGSVQSKKEPLDLAEAVRGALVLLGTSLSRDIELEQELPPTGRVLAMDATHIDQILTNLVLNAAEAIGDGAGRIRVAVGVVGAEDIRDLRFTPPDWEPGEGAHACITVTDSGSGMDAATRDKIFDPFFSTRFTGRGLGLPVVLGLVRSYRGAISVESQPGSGSTFRIFFPLPEGDARGVDKGKNVDAGRRENEGLLLLVEDEPLLLGVARAMLERLGYQVVTASDGVEAVEAFRSRRDDIRCVVLDLTLPRMDGWQVLATLRSLRPGLPVVLASGYDQAQVMAAGRAERPQYFLQKPYAMKTLHSAVEASIAASSS